MLKEFAKFSFEDQSRKNNFVAEVNWNEQDKNINESKIIKFTFPNGDISFVKREHLHEFLMVIGTPEEQRKMIPQKITTTRQHQGLMKLKALKDVKKGEEIISSYSIVCDNVHVESIVGPVKKQSAILEPVKSKFT